MLQNGEKNIPRCCFFSCSSLHAQLEHDEHVRDVLLVRLSYINEKISTFDEEYTMQSVLSRSSMNNLTKSVRNYNILIVGAGIAGPAFAYFLQRYGMRPVIVERASKLRLDGQTIDLRDEGKEIVRRMGIESKIREKITHDQGVLMVDSQGRTRASFAVNDIGENGYVAEIEILRGEFATILYESTRDNAEYIFGDYPESIDDDGDQVQVKFGSGMTRKFDLVIGADGIHSKTRQLVFGNTPISYTDLYIAYFAIPVAESDSNWSRWYNAPGGRCIILRPDNQNMTRVLLFFRSKERGYERLDVDAQKSLLQKVFADAGFEASRVLRDLSNTDNFYFDCAGQVKMDRWTRGRVALIGDAGYCPSLLTGMGTNMAFVGAYILAGELARHRDYNEAFKQYEILMRPYVAETQKLFPGYASAITPKTRAGIAFRNAILSITSKPAVAPLLKKLLDGRTKKNFSLPDYETLIKD